MKTFLFYDTETTGLPLWKEPSDHPDQPHLTQIAALLTDESGAKLGLIDLLIRPDGWVIPEELQKLTGITMERAETGGVGEEIAVAMFIAMWRRLRDWFAGRALAGWLASFGPDESAKPVKVAEFAYEVADAMLRAREADHA